MSPAEMLVKHALDGSDRGADTELFWSTLRRELRAWLDASAHSSTSMVHMKDTSQRSEQAQNTG
jgi:hypothetical protein